LPANAPTRPLGIERNVVVRVRDWSDGKAYLHDLSGTDRRRHAVMPNPADGSIWGSVAFRYPGAVLRFDPRTRLSEIYNVPAPGFGVRGADIDRKGVLWV
jgi:streptogramin lyase